MKERVKNMFAELTMPEETEKKIRSAMGDAGRKKRKPVCRSLATAAAVLVMLIVLSPQARAAFDNWVVKYFWPDSDLTIYEEINENGIAEATIAVVDTEAPPFAQIINGRLYFLGNGQKIDITDQIGENNPYFYTYVDEYGLTHEMVVGYSGTIENYGIYEFIWKEENGEKSWTAGTGRNFLSPETETRYPWVDIVWEELDIPWSKPE